MKLEGKTILIISPQQWEGLRLSKHYYAEELVKLNNKVYFLPPPIKDLNTISITTLENGVNLINHGHYFPYNLFFRSKKLYFLLLKTHIKRIVKQIDQLDIVWSFDGLRFLDLNLFNAKLKIYHPVDIQNEYYLLKPAGTADIIISVTDKILSKFSQYKKTYKIGHGVSENFIDGFDKEYIIGNELNFCYAGNLTMHGVDFKEIIAIITDQPNVNFHFIGPYSNNNEENTNYISFLKSKKNVFLYGLVKPDMMRELFKKMDGFLLCYDPNKEQNGGTNSHKILEYLSTGKVIVSSPIVEYLNTNNLLEMSVNTSFQKTFTNVIENIDSYNSSENIKTRYHFAKENTYRNQILRIDKIVTSHL
jgi:glycosyltransferase involved in cell wall biosynthesis